MKFRTLIIALLVTGLYCGLGPDSRVAGTETDTGEIVGIVVYSDSTPVQGADVIMRDQSKLKFIIAQKLGKNSAARKFVGKRFDSTKTSPAGVFVFDSVDTGNYYIEINDHDSLGALVEAQISESEPEFVVDTILLRRKGAIEGKVDPELVNVLKGTQVYIQEIDRIVSVDSVGYFIATGLPQWDKYTIRIIIGDSLVITESDTLKIDVSQNDTTQLANVGSKTGTVQIQGIIKEFGK
jgi:hypothetical protein